MLGKGHFSIYFPKRGDRENFLSVPVKVSAEIFLSPSTFLGPGECKVPIRARAEKLLKSSSSANVINVPIKIEAEIILSPVLRPICSSTLYRVGVPLRDIQLERNRMTVIQNWKPGGTKLQDIVSGFYTTRNHTEDEWNKIRPVIVQELRLEDTQTRTRELSRQIGHYADQVWELNRRLTILQDKLRQEEINRNSAYLRAASSEKKCGVLERRGKAAEKRAKVAERRNELIKHHCKHLSIICAHQGIQLKALSNQINDLFQNFGSLDATELATSLGGNGFPTIKPDIPFKSQNPKGSLTKPCSLLKPIFFGTDESRPGSPRTNCLYQTVALHELGHPFVWMFCKRVDMQKIRQMNLMDPDEEERLLANGAADVLGTMVNRLLQWGLTCNPPLQQQVQDLCKRCSKQASRLQEVSQQLDCFPKMTRVDFVDMVTRKDCKDRSSSPTGLEYIQPSIAELLRKIRVDGLQDHTVQRLHLEQEMLSGVSTPGETPRSVMKLEVTAWRFALWTFVQALLLASSILVLPTPHMYDLPPT